MPATTNPYVDDVPAEHDAGPFVAYTDEDVTVEVYVECPHDGGADIVRLPIDERTALLTGDLYGFVGPIAIDLYAGDGSLVGTAHQDTPGEWLYLVGSGREIRVRSSEPF